MRTAREVSFKVVTIYKKKEGTREIINYLPSYQRSWHSNPWAGLVLFFWASPAVLKHTCWIIHSVWVGPCFAVVWLSCGVVNISIKESQNVCDALLPRHVGVFSAERCNVGTKMSVAVLAPGGFCSTMQSLIPTWATARACPTWWPRCSPRSRMKATPSGALSASWRTPSSSAPRGMRTWRGSW